MNIRFLNFYTVDTGLNLLIFDEKFILLSKIEFDIGAQQEQISCTCLSYDEEKDEELVRCLGLELKKKIF